MARERFDIEDFDHPLGRPARVRTTPEQRCLRDMVVAAFLSIEATRNGWDCLVIDRPTLCRLLSVKRLSTLRLDQFCKVLPRWFSFHKLLFQTDSPSAVHSLIVSTQSFSIASKVPALLPQRLEELHLQGIRAGDYSLHNDRVDVITSLEAVIDELRAIVANR